MRFFNFCSIGLDCRCTAALRYAQSYFMCVYAICDLKSCVNYIHLEIRVDRAGLFSRGEMIKASITFRGENRSGNFSYPET